MLPGLMMDFPLTLSAILRRAGALYGDKRIVSRLPDRTITRTTYAEMIGRTRRLAVALKSLGVQPGDRVATLAWNHAQHLEAYFAIPAIGAVVHTLNLRLHPDDLAYIAKDGGDRILLVDESLLPLFEQFRSRVDIGQVIVMSRTGGSIDGLIDYESLIASADATAFREEEVDERAAAAMCYTSGTTGRPRGVLYSHRALALHSLATATVSGLGVAEPDTVMPVVPMFHVNAWGLPFTAALVGANQVLPGPYLDPASLLELMTTERVSITGGVPTVWLGVLQALDASPGVHDLSALRKIFIGGSAAPLAMIRGFQERHHLEIVHAWGMTEMSPIGTVCHVTSRCGALDRDAQLEYRARQGTPLPFIEIRARGAEGLVPWDGKTPGELEVRGPWVASEYFAAPGSEDRFTADGWFRTGDIVTIDPHGCMEICDRAKDLIKSGGEWISSVALENALIGHPAVAEAAVVAVAHPTWDERPLAIVVRKPGTAVTADDLRAFLAPKFAKWWLPDAFEFIDQIPRTSTGKFLKSALRERYRSYYAPPPAQT